MTDDNVPMTEWVEAFPTEPGIYQSEAYQRWLMEQEACMYDDSVI
jgi:hypothetical protein